VPVSALTGFGVETLKAVLFFKVPGYAIVKVVGKDGVRGLRIGDVTFVAVPSRGAEVREAGITYI
jgi:GTP-binding protein HflX